MDLFKPVSNRLDLPDDAMMRRRPAPTICLNYFYLVFIVFKNLRKQPEYQ
jgi:hypothetical protein